MTNFGAAKIRQDSLTRLQLRNSIPKSGAVQPSSLPVAHVARSQVVGIQTPLKEQDEEVDYNATNNQPEPSPEVPQLFERFRLTTNTEEDVANNQDGLICQVISGKEETVITSLHLRPPIAESTSRRQRKLSHARALSKPFVRGSVSLSASQYLIEPGSVTMRPTSLLVASLGNPPPYHSTRHSAAHIILKQLQSNLNLSSFTLKSRAYGGGHVSVGADVGRPEFTLWQSPSLMNVSGPPLLKAWKNFVSAQSASPSNPVTGLIILHDEMELEPGKVKAKMGATSPRGHNGIKSVQASLQSAALLEALGNRYVKIGIGIGRPTGGTRETRDVSAYVLGQLTSREKDGLERATSELEGLLYQEMARIGQSAS